MDPKDSIPPAYVAWRASTWAGKIDSLESIPGLLKHFKSRALAHWRLLHLSDELKLFAQRDCVRYGIFKLLSSPGIDSNEAIPQGY
jgi:hypothetical protein